MEATTLPEWLLLAIGFGGQGMFSLRFVVQWWASERAHRSVMPVMFWYFSIAGGLALFVYAALRLDPVFMLGQGLGLVVYLRNLWLIHHPGDGAAGGEARHSGA